MATKLTAVIPITTEIKKSERDIFERQRRFATTLRGSTVTERLAKLEKLRLVLERRRDDINQAAAADFGKPAAEVELTEIFPVLHEIAHAKRHLKKWMKPVSVSATRAMLGTAAQIRHEPKGVCLIISPWNYPFNLTFGPLVSAIAAGNTAMLKPSELTPHCSQLIREIVEELYSPDEVAVFEGEAEVAQHLLSLPFDHIFFTGSPAIGRLVMRAASEHLTSVTLELGGKSPAIVDETANLENAARNIVWGKFANNGQTCIAPDYVYVHQSVRDRFLEKAAQQIGQMYGTTAEAVGKSQDYCRIVNSRHFERLQGLLDDARQKGASIAAGGATEASTRFIAPTILTDVPIEAKVMQEEIFGPLLPVLVYTDLDQVLKDINSRPKPLALYVFSKDKARTEKVLRQAPAGGSCVNQCVVHFLHGNLPFGGVNNSGIGSAHGVYGFKAFSHERAVLVDHFSITHWLFPPYTRLVKMLIHMTSRYFA
ncbi:MAG: aldehyde dehydrogenase family protein [Alphaproteobacteria bacterium]|nr:aldehyde dehydrogenase family protein [Alphaproteobacteria bacterium]